MSKYNEKTNIHIKRLKSGDYNSFEFLYRQWSGKLYHFVMKLSDGDYYLAEEIVQLVFIKVWEMRTTLDPQGNFSAYLYTVAKNVLLNIYQHRFYERLYIKKLLSQPKEQHDIENEIEATFLSETIEQLIDQLPPGRKRIFELSRKSHFSNREIAEILDISENTVETQIKKALLSLRKKLSHYLKTILF